MPKLLYVSVAFMLTAASAMAGPVSKDQARQKAAAFALKDGRSLSLVKNSVHKAPQSNGQSTSPYYVFDMADNAGFVIVSGDDRTREIIGYTESGSYDAEALPDNMKSWLQMVADRINTLPEDYTVTSAATPAVPMANGVPMASVVIGPLMSSTWNQGSPYWNQCPYRNGSRCYTGCTATAFAQVMYYHRYPTGATTGIPGYEDSGIYIDALGSTTFNWNAMYPSYGANDNANEEVAKLMRYVGQGALMHYTEGGSGAAFVHAINALKNYFGYPSDIYEIYKDNYSSYDWMNALYSELYYGRPVLIEGYSDSSYGGGHAFVCDGYRDDGCFHINWGWGGWSDGYFSLDVLNPDDSSGMGAAQGSNGYYWHEGAVMNVRNPNGSSGGGDGGNSGGSYTTTDRGVASFYQDANYGGYGYSLPEGSFTLSQMQAYGIQNDDISSLKVLPGYKVTLYADDNFSGATAVYTGDAAFVGSDWNDQASSIRIEPNGVTGISGIYKLQNRNSGQYLDLDGNSVAENTAIVQWEDEGLEDFQQWEFIEVESGVYAIQSMTSGGKGLDVAYASVDNSTQVLLYPYNGGSHQQFILVDKGDGYYQIIARHCGKAVEIPGSSTTHGEWIKLWENNGSNCQQWLLKRNQPEGVAMATFYKDAGYSGSSTALPEGSYTTKQLRLYGISDNNISSLRVQRGFKVTLYDGDNFSGDANTWTADASNVGSDWNDRASSIRIEPNGTTGISGIYKLQNRNSGQYLDLDGNSVAENTAIVQWEDEGLEDFQQWEFIEVESGVYAIQSMTSGGKGLDVAYASADNSAQVLLFPYNGGHHQQFILVDRGDGYYQIIARHCGKAVEIPGSSTTHGEWIKIWDVNDAYCQQWLLKRNQQDGITVATLFQDINYGGSSASLSEGSYTTNQMKLLGLRDNDITSIKVMPGFKVTAYTDDNFTGQSISFTADATYVGDGWNDTFSSLKIEPQGATGLGGTYKLQGYNSQLFWDFENATTATDAMLVQKTESNSASQEFILTELGDGTGVYSIVNQNSGKYIDVLGMNTANWADIGQALHYPNNKNQQWIAVDKGDGYYQFVARHCGKVIEVPFNRTNDGEELKIYDNNNQYCSWWKLTSTVELYNVDLTDNGGTYEVSHASVNAQEAPSMLFDNNAQTKYCAFINAGDAVTLVYHSTQKARISSYTLTSANDFDGRDPKSWRLEGSNDGQNWETIDQRSGETFSERFQLKSYDVNSSKEYSHFRLYVYELRNADITVFQIAEWQLFGLVPKAYDNGNATGIDQTVTPANDAPFNIYNTNGQLVKRGTRSTEGLPAGIYIINRRKVVVR